MSVCCKWSSSSLTLTECLLDEMLQSVSHVGRTRRGVLHSGHYLLLDGIDHKQQPIYRRTQTRSLKYLQVDLEQNIWTTWKKMDAEVDELGVKTEATYRTLCWVPRASPYLLHTGPSFLNDKLYRTQQRSGVNRLMTYCSPINIYTVNYTLCLNVHVFTWMPTCSSPCVTAVVRSAAARWRGSSRWSPCWVCGARCRSAAACVDWGSGLPRLCDETSSACTFLHDRQRKEGVSDDYIKLKVSAGMKHTSTL